MVIKGLLYGKKGFLTKLFEPYGIELQGIKMLEDDADGTNYRFIWDVRSLKKRDAATGELQDLPWREASRYRTVERLLQDNFPERDVEVEIPGNSHRVRVTRRRFAWRAIARVYFYTKDEEE